MNKFIKISIALLLVFAGISCEEPTEVIYDGSTSNRTFLSFPSTVFTLPVDIDSSASLEIVLTASTRSNVDRSYSLVLNTDPEATTADPMTYNLPTSVTIPANSYQGSFFIEGMDNGLLDTTPKTISFSVSNLDGNTDIDSPDITVTMFEVCPVPDTFMVGDYDIIDVDAAIGPPNGTENFEAGTVTIEATSPTSRSFDVGVLPAFSGTNTVTFNLVCNQLFMEDVDPVLSCGGGIAYIFTDDASNTYDISVGDDFFLITYTEDPNGSCGGPFMSSFSLTKL